MPCVRNDIECCFWPGPMQLPRAHQRTNNVVPAMNNHRGEAANSIDMFKQVVVSFEEAVVREVVTFYARQGDRLLGFAEFVNQFLIWQKS